MSKLHILPAIAVFFLGIGNAFAVELLVSGDFETPVGFDIPGWQLEKFATGSDETVNSANIANGPDPDTKRLFLTPFNGGAPLGTAQGNFNLDNLPAGNVDGKDFLIWQRSAGIVGTALPEDGDANEDMNVDGEDLTIWQNNFGRMSQLTNAILKQTVPVVVGETYSLTGTTTFEDNFSGFVTTLDAESPFGAIPSPTTSTFKMEFLDSGGAVIGSPATLDLRTEQTFPGFPVDHTPLVAQAPEGAVNVRVIAESRDMAWNGNATTMGNNQSAFYDNFSLTAAGDPGTELLTNPSLDDDPPDALDFWNLVSDPDASVNPSIFRSWIAPWANHTSDGTRGVWMSAFFGAHADFEPDPVDGTISQTADAVPGETYTFSGWTKFEQNFSGGVDTISATGGTGTPGFLAGMPSPTETTIELAFLDTNGDVIGTPLLIDVKEDREMQICGGASDCANDGDWHQHILAGVAPPGTVSARLTGSMIDAVYNANPQQSAFFDDFSLIGPDSLSIVSASVPEPVSILSLSLGIVLLSFRRSQRNSRVSK